MHEPGPIPTMTTSEYPTRYVAFENPGIIVLATTPYGQASTEAMVYSRSTKNPHCPTLKDGVEATVSKRRDYWQIQTNATRPTKLRTQRTWATIAHSLQSALITIRRFIREAEHWIEQGDAPNDTATIEPLTTKEHQQ